MISRRTHQPRTNFECEGLEWKRETNLRLLAARVSRTLFGELEAPADLGAATYRFRWLSSFDGALMSRATFETDRCNTVGDSLVLGAGPVEAITTELRGEAAVAAFLWLSSLLDACEFWSPRRDDDRIGFDGADWILEGWCEGEHRVWEVWSPEMTGWSGRYRSACEYLLQLASVPVPPGGLY